jgi:hypothetical protein
MGNDYPTLNMSILTTSLRVIPDIKHYFTPLEIPSIQAYLHVYRFVRENLQSLTGFIREIALYMALPVLS